MKDSKKYKGTILCGLCYPKAKEGETKGKGWHESPDSSGKAPDHRDAKLRAQAKGACNVPMKMKKMISEIPISEINLQFNEDVPSSATVNSLMESIQKKKAIPPILISPNKFLQDGRHRLRAYKNLGYEKVPVIFGYDPNVSGIIIGGNPIKLEEKEYRGQRYKTPINTDELYHVTFKSKSSRLLKEGIIPKKSSTYKNRAGGELKDSGTIYAFTNFDDAVRWASKMQFDFKKPTIVVAFRGNISEWGIDTHWQSAGAKGKWLKKKGTISPEDIIELIGVSQGMTQAVVQTGGTSKELTRMNGIMEVA